MKYKRTVSLILLFAVIGLLLLWWLPELVERNYNRVGEVAPINVSTAAKELHRTLFISDLHSDSLLWDRDLLRRSDYGHVDLPRLLQGNVALQVFGVVTKSPKNQNYLENADTTDRLTALSVIQRWPVATWDSLYQRALYQARKLSQFTQNSKGQLRLILNRQDFTALQKAVQYGQRTVGSMLSLEGAHALEGDISRLDRLYAAGYRIIGLTHFFDNQVAGSAHGLNRMGLSPLGVRLVKQMAKLRMLVDIAHASPATLIDVFKYFDGPVISTHSGVRATCDSPRNLDDKQIRRIANSGGLIGIAFFAGAVCGNSLQDSIRAIRYVADLVGVEYVALGSDFDGSVTTPIDASGLSQITQGLLDNKFSHQEINLIMGQNMIRLMDYLYPPPG